MAHLKDQIEEYANYFSAQAGGVPFCTPSDFKPVSDAILERIAGYDLPEAMETISRHRDVAISGIADWLQEHEITQLKHIGEGANAAAFEIQTDSPDVHLVLRIGPEGLGSGGSLIGSRRAWCPLVVQPYSTTLMASRENLIYLSLEIMPFIKCVRGNFDFSLFLREHILPGTLYDIHSGNDLAVMSDGTPVFIDPGDLNLARDAFGKLVTMPAAHAFLFAPISGVIHVFRGAPHVGEYVQRGEKLMSSAGASLVALPGSLIGAGVAFALTQFTSVDSLALKQVQEMVATRPMERTEQWGERLERQAARLITLNR